MSIFPAGYLNSHKDDADDAIDTDKEKYKLQKNFDYTLCNTCTAIKLILDAKTKKIIKKILLEKR